VVAAIITAVTIIAIQVIQVLILMVNLTIVAVGNKKYGRYGTNNMIVL
jgi:hypothetical protein